LEKTAYNNWIIQPDFKSVFGGVGTASMAGSAQQAPKAEEKVEAKAETPKVEAEVN
jgi:hypothetical protein